jgi:catechol 2,3-dioxygenase-like lactoylglutathione lyase family enzyme
VSAPLAYRSSFPVLVCERLSAARDFYVRRLGFRVVFEVDWYVQLHAPRVASEAPIELALMRAGESSQPSALHCAYRGDGVILTLEVADVNAFHAVFDAGGCEQVVPLRDEPWGQRHLLDFVQAIPPDPAYAAAYRPAADPGAP